MAIPENWEYIVGLAAAAGAAVGGYVYGARKAIRAMIENPDTPMDVKTMLKSMESAINAQDKRISALIAQGEYTAESIHTLDRRLSKVETNGKKR